MTENHSKLACANLFAQNDTLQNRSNIRLEKTGNEDQYFRLKARLYHMNVTTLQTCNVKLIHLTFKHCVPFSSLTCLKNKWNVADETFVVRNWRKMGAWELFRQDREKWLSTMTKSPYLYPVNDMSSLHPKIAAIQFVF